MKILDLFKDGDVWKSRVFPKAIVRTYISSKIQDEIEERYSYISHSVTISIAQEDTVSFLKLFRLPKTEQYYTIEMDCILQDYLDEGYVTFRIYTEHGENNT